MRTRGRERWFAASTLALLTVVTSCGGGPDPTLFAPEGFTQEVPASTATLELIGVAGEVLEDGTRIEPYWLAKTELTWEAFDAWRLANDLPEDERAAAIDAETRPTRPYGAPDYGWGTEGFATISISAHSAASFCAWLTEKTGRTWRLPTATEWERACRAGGDPLAAGIDAVAWTAENAENRTHPVGTKAANAWGFHDMLGNAGEWCRADDDEGRVLCGGSYADPTDEVGPGFRREATPAWNARDPQLPQSEWWLSDGPFCGFRPLCEVDAKEE